MPSVQQLIEALSPKLPERESFGAVIRPRLSPADDTSEANHEPIGLVYADHESKEVLLVPLAGAGRRRRPMTLGEVVAELKALGTDCADYSVEATFQKPRPGDLLRIDLPIQSCRFSRAARLCFFRWH